ncbi:acetyl-CoA carboxylase, carboxyl transferase, alpha subunit [Syntrophotalea carbinolica DSM 2380]|uniref:Acetyl-coenzyme A carboxylase carboxyl transferase subunit alpha n=1 Tax=Syntrophotalea carbinolica (strain DSM 2380 / NBRC 103641 / GraBd1) TaxID=338963 RepID=ACCA_SYNC1|nr:acetyl-CoA carboxylase carboxyltransferase subunit alpha [Syntrophotalea carbinolica]Q3A585.1 RecName: Full=Acetyl-coenzyme A carboxylase carboxyl transferase subunit alpha; Short=ACCase subunit alpha; Short=Acetyl-CoA carboxylase carboxyltransferase subunit alpha [Syntrophotalea carbinolica DSM 2380]ABA88472.1 acetyl-CoA carboxylase, carboxyl transferase, alpha subunit [Syntrophotalea carbinolica DSM 2380]
MQFYLDFEKPLVELEQKLSELRDYSTDEVDFSGEIQRLEKKAEKLRREIFSNLNRWQVTQLARHVNRPFTLDFVEHVFTDWFEVHGDRNFRDDPALVCGFARLDGQPCAVIGHQKGRDTKEKVYRNFGMPNPEGYRKALRVMQMAEQFGLPIFTFVDTPGAFPGIGAEERGQAEAIARNLREMAALKVPVIVTVTGEGGSGGALAVAVGNRVLMMENAVYSVISPEGCAAILWKDGAKGPVAAEALKLTAGDIQNLGCVIDEVIPEPLGGAHSDHKAAAEQVRICLKKHLDDLKDLSSDELREQRYQKLRAMTMVQE